MKIPTGEQFGGVVARPGPMIDIDPNANGASVARALQQIGQDGMSAARQELQHTQELRNRVQSANTLAGIRGGARDVSDKLRQDLTHGNIKAEDLPGAFDSMMTEHLEEQTRGLPGDMAALVKAGAAEFLGQERNRLLDSGVIHTRQLLRADLLTSTEQYERDAIGDRETALTRYEQLMDQMGPAAGLAPDEIVRQKSIFRERTALNSGKAMINTARDDMKALDSLQDRFRSKEFRDLSPESANQLEQGVLARKQYLLNKQAADIAKGEANAAKRERVGEMAVREAQTFFDGGGVADPVYEDTLLKAVKGTTSAAAMTTLLKEANENAGFAHLTIDKQRQTLLELRSKSQTEGGNPGLERRLQNLERIHNSSQKQLDEDPLMYGAKRGLVDVRPLVFNTLDELVPQMATRLGQAMTVSSRTGRPVSPLLAGEAESLSRILGVLPVPQQAQAVRMLAHNMDTSQSQALARQINAKDNALSLALYAAPGSANQQQDPVELILRGRDAVKSGRLKADDGTAKIDHARIARELSAVPWSSNQARDAAVEAARLAYDGLRDGGRTSVSQAIAVTSGQLSEWADSKVPIPQGWTPRQFRKALETYDVKKLEKQAGSDEVLVGGQPLSLSSLVSNINAVRLIPAGRGSYALESGGQLVTTKQLRPLRINVLE